MCGVEVEGGECTLEWANHSPYPPRALAAARAVLHVTVLLRVRSRVQLYTDSCRVQLYAGQGDRIDWLIYCSVTAMRELGDHPDTL